MSQLDQHPADAVDPDAASPGPSRRQVLLTGGVVVAAAAVTAACGSSSSSSGSGPSGSGGGGSATVKAADVPVGGGVILSAQKVVVTQPTAGQFKAFSAVCTHQGCAVTSVADGVIVCPCHDSRFSASDGSVTSGPAPSALSPVQVSVSGDQITVSA